MDIQSRWKAGIFTKIAQRCLSLAYNVLLILCVHILLGGGWGGVGWTAHLIRALTSPLSKSDEIIPNWCQYGLGFGPLQAHWQVRLQEGTLMKRALFALLKPLFLQEDRFLPKSLMTAFEVLINPWPCSFETPWIPWLLKGEKKRETRPNKSKMSGLFLANKVLRQFVTLFENIYLQVKLIKSSWAESLQGWGRDAMLFCGKEHIGLGGNNLRAFKKENNMTHFLKELLWSREISELKWRFSEKTNKRKSIFFL